MSKDKELQTWLILNQKKKSEKLFLKRRCEKLCGLKILGGKILWGQSTGVWFNFNFWNCINILLVFKTH